MSVKQTELLQGRIRELEAEVAQLQQRIGEAEVRISTDGKLIERLEVEKSALNRHVDTANAAIEQQIAEKRVLRQRIERLTKALEKIANPHMAIYEMRRIAREHWAKEGE